MTEQADGQMSLFDPDTWCGKTSPELSAATKAKISELSSKKPRESQIKPPLYLDLRRGNGLTAEPLWEMGGPLLGEFSTRSFGEFPSVAVESHLSQILEVSPHPKYFLSAKACQGILNRAERREKELPPMLKAALIQQSASKSEPGAVGGVKVSSYSTIEQERSLPSTINVCYGISAYESNAMKSSSPHSGVYIAETARTLDNNGGAPACNQGGMAIVAFRWRNGAKAKGVGEEEDRSPTLGTDNNAALCTEMTSTKNTIVENGVCPTLTARMGTGGNQVSAVLTNEPVISIDRAAYNQGINAKYDIGIDSSGTSQTIVSKGPNAVCCGTRPDSIAPTLDASYYKGTEAIHGSEREVVTTNAIVRRLTPLECERLQGYPDHWTDIGDWIDSKGKKHKEADSPRYKALGNSIALPNWMYVLTKLNEHCKEHTMSSLFDGIGGFPLIWETLNGKGSTVWASEIEEFPIAVTKLRFPENRDM